MSRVKRLWGVLGLFLGFVAVACQAEAEPFYSTEAIVSAIERAEGGAQTRHPYGILAHYQHTTPRQACINTVNHARRDWEAGGRRGDFLDFLANRYAPTIGATNDPTHLNKNWKRNVEYYLERQA